MGAFSWLMALGNTQYDVTELEAHSLLTAYRLMLRR